MAVAALSPIGLMAQKESGATDRLHEATDVLADMTHEGDKGIPQDLLNKAKCVVIVPNMKKAGFIFGAKYGRGFAMCRKPSGAGWSAPAAMRIEGGSFGLQIGGSESDVILLVMNDGGMKRLLEDKFTLGGDASVAAGPVGRTASAQTDAQMHAEMLSWSRTRGIFAGLSLEGATLRPDHEADKELYGRDYNNRQILMGDAKAPAAAEPLMHELDRISMARNR
ncbi:MAG TPA: lipid-binding SYLF domain-containing protein [Bryobacteraceae bacterium]|nr:lipid-binding SYLF domain-containing protein [Bryobacteraceae bacterium]